MYNYENDYVGLRTSGMQMRRLVLAWFKFASRHFFGNAKETVKRLIVSFVTASAWDSDYTYAFHRQSNPFITTQVYAAPCPQRQASCGNN